MLTTAETKALVEGCGYQFLKDQRGWACFDADDRSEVPRSRSPRLGEAVWQTVDALDIGEMVVLAAQQAADI